MWITCGQIVDKFFIVDNYPSCPHSYPQLKIASNMHEIKKVDRVIHISTMTTTTNYIYYYLVVVVLGMRLMTF